MDQLKHPDPNLVGSPYWICDFCARARGGVYFKTASTASSGIKCGYCGGDFQVEQYIYPSLDYIWPSQAARNPMRYKEWAGLLADRYASAKSGQPFYEDTDSKFVTKEWSEIRDAEYKRILKGWGIE